MIKNLYTAGLVSLLLFSCTQQTDTTLHQNTAATAEPAFYGNDFSEQEVLSVTQLQDAISNQDSVQATISGEIVESCQSKGCWMDVRLSDNSIIKVTFRNYGFFVPAKDLKGRTVVVKGTARREMVSVEDQRHFAEDAGKPASEVNAITSPKEELRFVADGVKIK